MVHSTARIQNTEDWTYRDQFLELEPVVFHADAANAGIWIEVRKKLFLVLELKLACNVIAEMVHRIRKEE